MNKKDLPVMYSSVFGVCSAATVFFCFGFFCLYCITTINILGDPGAVSRVRRKGGMKVF